MPLFQNSVLNKYLKNLNREKLDEAFVRYAAYFHNTERQQNIRLAKEEQFQEGFLRELFVNLLGYTINPEPNYNLTTEFKNLVGSKKADGAIIVAGKALGVIELKGSDTTDLEKINTQAFSYKNNHPGCQYIITSNFEKLRFYIQNAVDHIEFNLFTLSRDEFALLWLCLHAESLLMGIPLKAKEESLLEEENITKKLYRDYKNFKTDLWQSLVKNHPEHDPLFLFKKTQKLLDRLLFIFFAEDKGLLPPNSISQIVHQWEKLRELDEYRPLYERLIKYFGYLNTGHQGKQFEIFAYNGGLFLHDEFLDAEANVADEILHPHILRLSGYDFASEVDVNILGHIFEHSLNEIEELSAALEGKTTDKAKTKRKKDGVFYTPKYITKYIVENTVGRLCAEKKAALGLVDEDYARGRANRKKETVKQLDQTLQNYRHWLLGITIVDPACGSGAFLNQALEFLMNEHRYIGSLESQLLGHAFEFPGVENHILENNLYGVDINEEGVEIAKLSLWLRTAKKGRKLSSLNNNLKCGNSLIDDPAVAGDKAFHWQQQFPEVFAKGGFDVVIGNPPYVRQELITPYKPFFEKRYKTFAGTADLYTYFIEMGVDELINTNGVYSIIVANKWMRARFGQPLREWMKQKEILEIIDFGDLPVFADATAYPCILSLKRPTDKAQKSFAACEPKDLMFGDLQLYVNENAFQVDKNQLNKEGWALVNNRVSNLIEKLKRTGQPLGKFVNGKIYYGIKTGFNEAFVIDRATRDQLIAADPKSSELIKPFLAGRDVKRYYLDFQERYLIFSRRGIDIEKYPAIKGHLEGYRKKLEPKPKDFKGNWPGRKEGSYKWYELQDSIDYFEEFEKEKLILPDISIRGNFAFDRGEKYFAVNTCYIIPTSQQWLAALLNSKLLTFYYKKISPEVRGGYLRYIYQYLVKMPIGDGQELSRKSDLINEAVGNFEKTKISLTSLILTKFNLDKLSQNLQNWPSLDFKGFLAELKKAKVKLSLEEEAEWLSYFTAQKEKANALQAQITQLDKEIDQMVYQLYGLSEEEIKIVEGV